MQARYQRGTLTKRKRKNGPDAWQFRYVEKGRRKSVLIGTLDKYPTKTSAQCAIEGFCLKINAGSSEQGFRAVTVSGLMDRYMAEYAPKRCRRNTRNSYSSLIETHIRPKWGGEYAQSVRPMLVEAWFDDYDEYEVKLKDGGTIVKPVTRSVKSHVRNLMHAIFQRAMFWEMLPQNPISLVHQSRKRLKTPRVITSEQFKLLVPQLAEPYRTMVIVHQCLGLRCCETVALQWQDVNFEKLNIDIRRSFVRGEVNLTKTEASARVLPLDPDLAHILLEHRARSTHRAPADYVFAGKSGNIRWPESILQDHIKPAARRAEIGSVGWHTFRHTYATLLADLDTSPAVQKELSCDIQISPPQ